MTQPEHAAYAQSVPTWLTDAAHHLAAQSDAPFSLDALAARAGVSVAMFRRAFQNSFGVTAKEYHAGVRRAQFRDALRDGESVTAATYQAGYGSPSRVVGRAGANLAMPAQTYSRGGAGEHITWTIAPSAFGYLLLAATARGVCQVAMDDAPDVLEQRLADEFPAAGRVQAQATDQLSEWFALLELYLTRRGPRPDLPLDLRGTAFQLSVWRFLLSIPEGQTQTYGQLAHALGKPKSFRAVANACGANRVAVLVPCHRVLRSDGGLGGYRWGSARKQRLLSAEGVL